MEEADAFRRSKGYALRIRPKKKVASDEYITTANAASAAEPLAAIRVSGFYMQNRAYINWIF